MDNSYVYGTSKTSYRVGPAASFSNSVGAAKVQLDLVMDGSSSAKSGVDQHELGASMDLGAATVAFAQRKMYMAATSTTTETFAPGAPAAPPAVAISTGTPAAPPTVNAVAGTPGEPTAVRVVPAVEKVDAQAAVAEATGVLNADGANSRTLLKASNMRNVSDTNAVTALAEITEAACNAVAGAVWVEGAATSNK